MENKTNSTGFIMERLPKDTSKRPDMPIEGYPLKRSLKNFNLPSLLLPRVGAVLNLAALGNEVIRQGGQLDLLSLNSNGPVPSLPGMKRS